ncbi:MAG: hypothetical protein NC921_04060 [Candidatus Omnitrophica bacterium]|nr:hypothetical protein [Candidatus Omnitrophota bacterium]
MSVKKGNRYKYKTKKYFENLGYNVEFLETYIVYKRGDSLVYKHKDILYSDLIVYNENEVMLVQVKVNKKNIAEARKNYDKLKLPSCIKKLIVVWIPGLDKPHILCYN